MDEPLSNLDAKLRDGTRKEIVKLHRNLQATIVYVTHDQIEAMTMATRIVVMNEGYIQQVGTPSQVYNEPANLFVAGFMGMPPMNFFIGRIEGKNFVSDDLNLTLNDKQLELLATYKDRPLTLGIRPEYFSSDLKHRVDKNWLVDVKVNMVEYSGSSQIVTFELSGQTINAKLNTRDSIEMDDVITLAIKREAALFFDTQSTLRIVDTYQSMQVKFDGEGIIFNEQKVTLPKNLVQTLKLYKDKVVSLNFRLEDMVQDPNGIELTVFDAIPFGDIQQVVFTDGISKWTVRMQDDISYIVGNRYAINFNLKDVYFTDIETKQHIKELIQ